MNGGYGLNPEDRTNAPRRESEQLREAAVLLAFAGPAHEPPEGLGERVLLGVLEFETARQTGANQTAVRRWTARRAAVAVVVAGAGLLLAVRLRRAPSLPAPRPGAIAALGRRFGSAWGETRALSGLIPGAARTCTRSG